MAALTQSYWPATPDAELYDLSCGEVLRRSAARWPDKVALVDPATGEQAARRWTFCELETESRRYARLLADHFPAGTHVAIFAANCPEWVFVQFGAALAGMVLVTVNPASSAEELAYILRQSDSRAVFHETAWRGNDMAGLIDRAVELEALTLDLRCNVETPGPLLEANEAEASKFAEVDPHSPAMIQYTSGTTGYPKGVLLSHHQIANTSRIMSEVKLLDERTINLSVAPLFHTGGCVGGVLGAVQTGGTLILMRAFETEAMLDLIEAERVTYTFAVPTMLVALLESQRQRPRDLSSLTMVFSGGSTVPVDVVRRTESEFGARLIIGYGLTESSPAITHTRPGDSPKDISETIGRAIPLVEVKIVDPGTGDICAIDQPGELCCRGFNVMMGYYKMPDETADTVDADGWLHTGDLCAMDDRGYCRITGRLKDMIIRGGENIYPREIEEVLIARDDIASVAVFAIRDDYWGEEVGCAFIPAKGSRPEPEMLREHCSTSLARHKIPRHWFALDELPLTSSGKIQKFRLTELAAAGELEAHRL